MKKMSEFPCEQRVEAAHRVVLLGRCLTNDIHDDSIRLGNRDEGVVLLQVAIFNCKMVKDRSNVVADL